MDLDKGRYLFVDIYKWIHFLVRFPQDISSRMYEDRHGLRHAEVRGPQMLLPMQNGLKLDLPGLAWPSWLS
jgi:hypothetical protein